MTVLRDSYRRCLNTRRFAARHYEILMDSSPEVRPFFSETDPDKHKGTLRAMHVGLVAIMEGDELAAQYVRRVARKHGPTGLDVPRELYDLWVSSLIEAARECDTEFDPEVERAWRTAGEQAVELLLRALEPNPQQSP